jgi:hypothetical protein
LTAAQKRQARCDRFWGLFSAYIHDGVVHDQRGCKHSDYAFPCFNHDIGTKCTVPLGCFDGEHEGCGGCFSDDYEKTETIVWRLVGKGEPDGYKLLEFKRSERLPEDYVCCLNTTNCGYSFSSHRLCGNCIERVKAGVEARVQRIKSFRAALLDALAGTNVIADTVATYFFAPSTARCFRCVM